MKFYTNKGKGNENVCISENLSQNSTFQKDPELSVVRELPNKNSLPPYIFSKILTTLFSPLQIKTKPWTSYQPKSSALHLSLLEK